MTEIMQDIEKNVSKNDKLIQGKNRYGREFGISDEKMAKWKEEYIAMRIDTKKVLDEVRKHPIDISMLDGCPSFDIETQSRLLK